MNKVNQKVSQKIQGKPQGIIRSKKKHVKILQSSLNLPPKNVRPVTIPVQTLSIAAVLLVRHPAQQRFGRCKKAQRTNK